MGEQTPQASPILYLVVKRLPEVEDKKMSRNEDECKICGIPFSKKGASQTQKHVWYFLFSRFCYHAVCAACSPLTALHPDSNNSERICLVCYTHYLRVHIQEENTPKAQEKIKHELDKYQRDSLALHLEKVEHVKNDLKGKEKHLQDQITRLSMEVQERDTRLMTMSFKNEDNENLGGTESVAEYLKQMKEAETENLRLKSELNDLKSKPNPPPVVAQKQGCCCSVF